MRTIEFTDEQLDVLLMALGMAMVSGAMRSSILKLVNHIGSNSGRPFTPYELQEEK